MTKNSQARNPATAFANANQRPQHLNERKISTCAWIEVDAWEYQSHCSAQLDVGLLTSNSTLSRMRGKTPSRMLGLHLNHIPQLWSRRRRPKGILQSKRRCEHRPLQCRRFSRTMGAHDCAVSARADASRPRYGYASVCVRRDGAPRIIIAHRVGLSAWLSESSFHS